MAEDGTSVDAQTARREVAGRMADAAHSWLESLDAEQRTIGTGAAPGGDEADAERCRWFYLSLIHI